MKTLIRICLVGLIALIAALPAASQENSRLAAAIAQLLDHPAPPPPTLKEVAEAISLDDRWRDEGLNGEMPEPGPAATPGMITAYWALQARTHPGKAVAEAARWRLLEACLEDPRFYRETLAFLPDTPQAHERVKQYLDQPRVEIRDAFNDDKNGARHLRDWLMRHSGYLRDELIARASDVRQHGDEWRGGDDLAALARLDWAAALPLINRLLNSPDASALAVGLLYRHAEESGDSAQADALRERLQKIAADGATSQLARRSAVDALIESDWRGLDEWILSLLAATGPGDNSAIFDLLAAPVLRDPDRWIPILTRLVGHTHRAIHDAAVHGLSQFAEPGRARKDAIAALLPWLNDPNWATTPNDRAREFLLMSLQDEWLPEATPALVSLLQSDELMDRSEVIHVLGLGLRQHPDPRATAALRKALALAASQNEPVQELVWALFASGGLRDSDQTAALAEVAVNGKVRVEYGRGGRRQLYIEGDDSTRDTIAQIICKHTAGTPAVAAALVARWKKLRATNRHAAEQLWLLVQEWDQPALAVADAERIADGSADFETLRAALGHRATLQAHAGRLLQPLLARGGYREGISAALLDHHATEAAILDGHDREAQLALLACSRQARVALPVDRVAKLLTHSDNSMRVAAERYLESLDTPEARRRLQAQSADAPLILGARDSFDPKPEFREDWTEWEESLRERVKTHRADEIFGRLTYSHSDDGSQSLDRIEVRVRGDEADVCRRSDKGRWGKSEKVQESCRQLARADVEALRALFDEVAFDNLPPLKGYGDGFSGSEQEFVRINAGGGRRVYSANLDMLRELETRSPKSQTPHERIEAFFDRLLKDDGLKSR
jgi:hypothetical protein